MCFVFCVREKIPSGSLIRQSVPTETGCIWRAAVRAVTGKALTASGEEKPLSMSWWEMFSSSDAHYSEQHGQT